MIVLIYSKGIIRKCIRVIGTSPQEDIQRIILNIDFVRQWIEFIVEKLFGFGSKMLFF
jgi:hypothetical protein